MQAIQANANSLELGSQAGMASNGLHVYCGGGKITAMQFRTGKSITIKHTHSEGAKIKNPMGRIFKACKVRFFRVPREGRQLRLF